MRIRASSASDSVLEEPDDELYSRGLVPLGPQEREPVEHEVDERSELARLEVVAELA
jgi:hypothetical protein